MMEKVREAITRTVTLSDLTPQELASIFAQYDSDQQAQFFDALVEEGKSFASTGWDMQACWLVPAMSQPAQALLATFASWLPDDEKSLI